MMFVPKSLEDGAEKDKFANAGRLLAVGYIQRDSGGKFAGFGTSLVPQFEELEGRFAQMMPPKEPGDKDAQMARMLLTAMGVIVEGKGADPMWN